jgi:serine/threonine-protein kinase
MGEVWAAVGDDGQVPREVAVKVLLARAALKPDLVRRFEREAKIASAIQSPFVCQLIEVGRGDDGAHLLVFEHLSGESLADRLKREQYLPFSEVGPIIDDVLQGLAAAHAAGVVHRDLKPGNIFLVQQADAPDLERRGERAKILDFGISKLTRRESAEREPTLTAFDATLGSFAYMAPEQVRGAARADERADIYAVGAVTFRSLSGRLPFEGSTAAGLVALKLEKSAPTLAEATGEQWPAGIERFLERALERDREMRFSSAGEALEVWRSITTGPRSAPNPAWAASPPPPKPRPGPPSVPRPRHDHQGRGPGSAIPVPAVPTPRPPMQSYQVVEDNPTEVDGPPTMTIEGAFPPPPSPPGANTNDSAKKRRTGRP